MHCYLWKHFELCAYVIWELRLQLCCSIGNLNLLRVRVVYKAGSLNGTRERSCGQPLFELQLLVYMVYQMQSAVLSGSIVQTGRLQSVIDLESYAMVWPSLFASFHVTAVNSSRTLRPWRSSSVTDCSVTEKGLYGWMSCYCVCYYSTVDVLHSVYITGIILG